MNVAMTRIDSFASIYSTLRQDDSAGNAVFLCTTRKKHNHVSVELSMSSTSRRSIDTKTDYISEYLLTRAPIHYFADKNYSQFN